jgi:1,4-dihydroxy-6-naphthoate synthase
MQGQKISIGYSPCPNDTFIFFGLMYGKITALDIALEREVLADVETLNSWAFEGRLDVTKLSFHALGHVLDQYVMLLSGSALGRGCGPLLVAGSSVNLSELSALTVAIPGRYTTAAALLKQFAPACNRLVEMRFDEIMPAIKSGKVDCGVIIHESRFTYEKVGLQLVVDLGDWWEKETGQAIPLGCIAAKRSLGVEVIGEIDSAIHASILWAQAHPELCRDYIRKNAQELDDSIISHHINLYVNDFTKQIGSEGLAAVKTFMGRGRSLGILPESAESLTWK